MAGKRKGNATPLPLLLTLLLLGKLAGETTINGIIDWIKEREGKRRKLLNWPKRFPVNSTYSAALAACNDQEIAQAIAQVILKARAQVHCGSEPSRLVAQPQEGEAEIQTAMDGKTLRGTPGHTSENQPPVHLLALYECESGLVLAQTVVKSPRERNHRIGSFLASLVGQRQDYQHGCDAYAEEMVCRRAGLWGVLSVHREGQSPHRSARSGGFFC